MHTLISACLRGVPPEVETIAREEGLVPHRAARAVARGRIVIPANPVRPHRLCGDPAICIHEADAPGLIDDTRSLAMHFGARSPGIVPDTVLSDGDRIGDLRVIHTPGHTPGGICLYEPEEKLLFSGDTVFTGGSFGRYDFPGGDRTVLAASLERLGALEVEGLYPGHGEPVARGGGRHIAAAIEALRFYG